MKYRSIHLNVSIHGKEKLFQISVSDWARFSKSNQTFLFACLQANSAAGLGVSCRLDAKDWFFTVTGNIVLSITLCV